VAPEPPLDGFDDVIPARRKHLQLEHERLSLPVGSVLVVEPRLNSHTSS
jgi:hypothetical protein